MYGLGEVRDGASATYALFLKSRVVGENPLHLDKLFRKIKQFGGHARQGGGVCAIEMALWDIAGKVYNAPVYVMVAGESFAIRFAFMRTRLSRRIPRFMRSG